MYRKFDCFSGLVVCEFLKVICAPQLRICSMLHLKEFLISLVYIGQLFSYSLFGFWLTVFLLKVK